MVKSSAQSPTPTLAGATPFHGSTGRTLEAAVLCLMLAFFLALKSYGLPPSAGDENIYFYLASRIAHGAIPYRDFFFAHPPLHLLPASILCALFGPRLDLLEMLAPLFAALSGLTLWRLARGPLGPLQALVAVALFWFSHDLLRASTHHTGVNLGLLFLMSGLWAQTKASDRIAGLFYACVALTTLYLAPVAAALALTRWALKPKQGQQMVATGLALFAAVHLLFLMLAGGSFLDMVYSYHLHKPPVDGAFRSTLPSLLFRNPLLFWGPVMLLASRLGASARALPRALRRRTRPWPWSQLRAAFGGSARRSLLSAVAVASLVGLGLLANLGRLYHFYFLLLFPGLALLGGAGYGALLQRAWHLLLPAAPFQPRGSSERGSGRSVKALATFVLLAGVASGSLGLRSLALHRLGWFQKRAGEHKGYAWHPSPLLPALLDDAIRSCCFRAERVVGSYSTGVTGYLWHESRVLEVQKPLAAAIGTLATNDSGNPSEDPAGTLFGDSTSVPLLALMTGRRVALDEADTNFMRFRSGATDPEAFLQRLAAAPPSFVVMHAGRGIASVPEIRAWVLSHTVLQQSFDDPSQGRYLLYRSSTRP